MMPKYGGDLFDWIYNSNLRRTDEMVVARYSRELCEAVDFLQTNKPLNTDVVVIHRDIKPQNIFLENKKGILSLVLGDFGSACYARLNEHGHVERRSTLAGTPGYIAPEVVDRIGQGYDMLADNFAVGCTMYEMLEGKEAFKLRNRSRLTREEVAETCRESFLNGRKDYDIATKGAKDLVEKLLRRVDENPPRISMQEALQHSFLNPGARIASI